MTVVVATCRQRLTAFDSKCDDESAERLETRDVAAERQIIPS